MRRIALLLLAVSATPAIGSWPTDPSVNLPVCTASGDQRDPAILADGAGGAFIAWRDGRGGQGTQIYAAHVIADGTFDSRWPSGGLQVSTATDAQEDPRIASDGSGGAIIVWIDDQDSSGLDVFAQRLLPQGAVAPGWPATGCCICSAMGAQVNQTVIADQLGGAIVTWQDPRNGVDLDIYAQRLLSSGSVDPDWPVNGLALCLAAGDQVTPVLATDDAGGAFVSWFDRRNPVTDDDLYAHHVLAVGITDPAWPDNGLAVSVAPNRQIQPQIIPDGSGAAMICWMDTRMADGQIRAQRILSNGAVDPVWPVEGCELTTAGSYKSFPTMVPDGAGGAIVAWEDARGGTAAHDIYSQRVLASGVVDATWPSDGRAVCTAPGAQYQPQAVSDSQGGILVSWWDERSGANTPDVYAHRVSHTGSVDPNWPSNGRCLSSAPNRQWVPMTCSDFAGGAIVVWEDWRSGSSRDVYAQRVQQNGELGGDIIGACCLANGQCVQLAPSSCTGTWAGAYVPCEPNPCPQLGACCLHTFCTPMTAGDCQGFGGSYQGDGVVCVTDICITSSVEAGPVDATPRAMPNPSSGPTTISFSLAQPGWTSVRIYDAGGRLVRVLGVGEMTVGVHEVMWDGRSDEGEVVGTGVYFARVEGGARASVARMVKH